MKNITIGKLQIGKTQRSSDSGYTSYPYGTEKWSLKFCTETCEYGIFRLYTKEEIDAIADTIFSESGEWSGFSDADLDRVLEKLSRIKEYRLSTGNRTNPPEFENKTEPEVEYDACKEELVASIIQREWK